jgi:hypothetical protein
MMSQTNEIVAHFLLNIISNGVVKRVQGTCEHEIMPDQNTVLVAFFIKLVFLKLPSTPDSDHVEVLCSCVLYHCLVGLGGCFGQGHFWRDVVTSSAIDVDTVQVENEGLSPLVWGLLQLNCPETDVVHSL